MPDRSKSARLMTTCDSHDFPLGYVLFIDEKHVQSTAYE